MQPNLFFHALAMLCSLGSVAMATFAVGPRNLAALAIGFAAASLAVRPSNLPDPAWVGGIVAGIAAAAVLRPRYAALFAATAGILAGIWMPMLEVAGVPLAAAALIAAAAPLCSALFSRDSRFAPLVVREEALLFVLVIAVVVAVAPGVAAGWQSATALNLQQKEVGAQVVPAWTLLLTLGAAAAGGLYTVWMRR